MNKAKDNCTVKELKILSYAKINIGLYVLNKREDGYHEILTFFQQIDLYDTLKFIKSEEGIRIISDHPRIPTGEKNLIWKAFHLFKNTCKVKGGLNVFVEKQIPPGAGSKFHRYYLQCSHQILPQTDL